jgi:hypothetical protein
MFGKMRSVSIKAISGVGDERFEGSPESKYTSTPKNI